MTILSYILKIILEISPLVKFVLLVGSETHLLFCFQWVSAFHIFQNVSHHFLLLNAVLCLFEQDCIIFIISIISAVGICIHLDVLYTKLN